MGFIDPHRSNDARVGRSAFASTNDVRLGAQRPERGELGEVHRRHRPRLWDRHAHRLRVGRAGLIIWYITTLAAIEADRVSCRDTCSESGFGCGDACDASAGLLSAVVTAGLIFMIPTLAFAIVSFILEIILAVKCNAAKRAIESGKGPQA